MPNDPILIYWDSCVFLHYIDADSDKLPVLDGLLAEVEASKGERKIITSAVSKVEVAYAASEGNSNALDPALLAQINKLWSDNSTISLVEFHDDIASLARDLMRDGITHGWSLKAMDAIHLASAKWLGASQFHTYDKGLSKYAPLVGCPICEPYVQQPQLPNLI